MDARTDIGGAVDGSPPPGLAEIVANNARRIALIEWRLGMVTDATLDDLTEEEAYAISGESKQEREARRG